MSRPPFILETSQEIPVPLDSVFPFFAAPENLEAITPPWLNFRILTPRPIAMKQGALIDYRIRLRGIPLRWRTQITLFEPPHRFVDLQVRGPYALWEHTHIFERAPTGTRIVDCVRYLPPQILLLSTLLERRFIRPELTRIFSYRASRISALLSPAATRAPRSD